MVCVLIDVKSTSDSPTTCAPDGQEFNCPLSLVIWEWDRLSFFFFCSAGTPGIPEIHNHFSSMYIGSDC
jgi:hypothetical protein